MGNQLVSLPDVVDKPLDAIECELLSGWRRLAAVEDAAKVAHIKNWLSSVPQRWPSVVRFSLHDPIFNEFCYHQELQSLWWEIWAGFGISLLEKPQNPIWFVKQQGFEPFDLCVGAHFFGLSIRAKRTTGVDYSAAELGFLRYAIAHYPSIHAVERYNNYLYLQLIPDTTNKWHGVLASSNVESLFVEAAANCLALLPRGKHVRGDNIGYGSYAYMLLAESYIRWLPYLRINTETTKEALFAIQRSMEYAKELESASVAAIANASFGAGFRVVDTQGVEQVGLVAVQQYMRSQISCEPSSGVGGRRVSAVGYWQPPAKRNARPEESTSLPQSRPRSPS